MRIGIVQLKTIPGDVTANCARIPTWTESAGDSGCDVVIFPEMIDTGFDLSLLPETASPWEGDREDSPLGIARKAAVDSDLFLICGLSERVENDIYNSTAIIDPGGNLVGKYRKTHLAAYPPFQEDRHIVPGDSLETVRIGNLNWGLLICYDLRFPEISRRLTLSGVRVLALTSAFPFPRLRHWKTLTRARAIENQVYVIASNRVGTDGGVTFCGSSCMIDPYGVTVAAAAEDREELIVGEIREDIIDSVRDYMPLLDQRREELY